MTPILHPRSNSERRYNQAHVKGRNVIERCNGVLKSRFRCLHRHRVLNVSPTTASKIINACAILHNLCMKHRVPFYDLNDSDSDDSDDDDNYDIHSLSNQRGFNVRNLIIRNHFS